MIIRNTVVLFGAGGTDVPRRAERAGGVVRRAEALPRAGLRGGDAGGRRRALASGRVPGRLHIAITRVNTPSLPSPTWLTCSVFFTCRRYITHHIAH